MRRCLTMVGTFLLLLSGVVAAPVTVDGVAAYVNDSVITVGEIQETIAPVVPQLRQVYSGKDLDAKLQEAYDEALAGLIENRLIMKAYENDPNLNKEALDKNVERRMGDFIKDRFEGDRQAFLSALKDEHLTLEEWRNRLRERIIVGFMKNREVDSRVVISPRDVRRVFENDAAKYQRPARARLRVILIHGGTNDTDRAVRLQLAQNTRAKLAGGDDFGDCARRVSEDGKAEKGGDWGWVEIADLRKELAGAVTALKPGGVSDVITVEGDYYIVKSEEFQAAGTTPFEEVRAAIENELRKKEARRLFALWI